ncbi:MAG: zinc-dependent peptidase [Deltaproteobacteria bacterium]|nr:zinc-dependent peptidase [Deltaproteobacteria bacterium]
MFGSRARRRKRILAEPFPPAWERYLEDNVAFVRRLDGAQQQRLRELIQVFVAEKTWEGCGGLELTEEMQVTVAAQACLLVLGTNEHFLDDVASILVYPTTVWAPPRRLGTFEQPRAPVSHGRTLLGEAWLGGPVVLAWDRVLADGREEGPGNLVFHELAHKLDMATGAIDGTPPLPSRAERKRWGEVCTVAYTRHRRLVEAGLPTLMDPYGATNEAEFFAVATEMYFTQPAELAHEHPALYRLLRDFYRVALPPPPPPPPAPPLLDDGSIASRFFH